MPICGGNGMGFLNVEDRLRVCGFYQPDLTPGGVTFLSHSGSLFSAMLHNKRGIGFNLVVSTGLELTTHMNDYLDWALDLESTTVAALFLETIRDPAGFVSSLRRAAERDVPVVALKVGASEKGRSAVATHSEGLAGDDAVTVVSVASPVSGPVRGIQPYLPQEIENRRANLDEARALLLDQGKQIHPIEGRGDLGLGGGGHQRTRREGETKSH